MRKEEGWRLGVKVWVGFAGWLSCVFVSGLIEGEGWMFRVSYILHFSYPAFFAFRIFHILHFSHSTFLAYSFGLGSWGAGRSEW